MPDEKVIAFMAGLRVYDDSLTVTHNERGWAIIWGSDGDSVAHVRGAPDDDMDADLAAHALVTAAHEYARWLPVIEAANDTGMAPDEWEYIADSLVDTWWGADAENVCRTVAAALREGSADE